MFNVADIVDVVRAMCGLEKSEDNAEVDYGQMRSREMAWFVTGHGPFNEYLYRFCGDPSETPEHLLFDCRQQHTQDLKELEAKYVVREISFVQLQLLQFTPTLFRDLSADTDLLLQVELASLHGLPALRLTLLTRSRLVDTRRVTRELWDF